MESHENLLGQKWDGKCPCSSHQEMFLNAEQNYECPSCRTQISSSERGICIHEAKGTGKFVRENGARISAIDKLAGMPSTTIVDDQRKAA